MKIKVSKVFADYLNKLANQGILDIEHAEVKTFSERGYILNVADPWDAEQYGDYDWDNDEYKAIVVVYPYEHYAMPKYLTTKLVTEEYKRSKVTNEQELNEMLKTLINI